MGGREGGGKVGGRERPPREQRNARNGEDARVSEGVVEGGEIGGKEHTTCLITPPPPAFPISLSLCPLLVSLSRPRPLCLPYN